MKSKYGKIFVGLSGGVDSSVSAALLKEQGYDVTGVFIKVWQPDWIQCTWREDRLDAMRVCAKLGIPFITLDLSKEYKKDVVDYMICEYKAGRTPNPDVMCNRYVKFGGFYKWAIEQGVDYVATGHYARVALDATREIPNPKSQIPNKPPACAEASACASHLSAVPTARVDADRSAGRQIQNSKLQTINYKLLTGLDSAKDQSYFLWTLTQEQLAHTLFPVGHLEKSEVRKIAKKFGLPTADKKDSQGLCFLGKIDVKEFLKHYIKPKQGDVLNENGEVVGTHDGAMFFTLGERIGIVPRKNLKPTEKVSIGEFGPSYVIGKDIQKNTLTVSVKSPEGTLGGGVTSVMIKNCKWLTLPGIGKTYAARVRYRQPLQTCMVLSKSDSSYLVQFSEMQTVAAGQSVVLYDGEVCLGGGVIV